MTARGRTTRRYSSKKEQELPNVYVSTEPGAVHGCASVGAGEAAAQGTGRHLVFCCQRVQQLACLATASDPLYLSVRQTLCCRSVGHLSSVPCGH